MKNSSISSCLRVAFIGFVCLSIGISAKAEERCKLDKRGNNYREVVCKDPTSERHVVIQYFRDKALVYQSRYIIDQDSINLSEFDQLVNTGQAVLDGKTIVYASNKHRTESTYKNGILLVIDEYAENGCMIQRNELAHYVGETLIVAGEYKCWDSDGQLKAEGSTKNGLKHGVFTKYKANGKVLYHSFYMNGELIKKRGINDLVLERNRDRKKRSLLTAMN